MVLLKSNGNRPKEIVQQVVVTQATTGAPTVSQPTASKATRKLVAADKLVQQWPEVMAMVKGKIIRVHAFLHEGKPMGLEDGQLVIKFGLITPFIIIR